MSTTIAELSITIGKLLRDPTFQMLILKEAMNKVELPHSSGGFGAHIVNKDRCSRALLIPVFALPIDLPSVLGANGILEFLPSTNETFDNYETHLAGPFKQTHLKTYFTKAAHNAIEVVHGYTLKMTLVRPLDSIAFTISQFNSEQIELEILNTNTPTTP